MGKTTRRGSTILALLSVCGVGYFGMVILVLSLIDSQFSQISEAASLYGVGRYAIEMNLGFLVGGIGLIAYALSLAIFEKTKKSPRAAAVLSFIGGAALIMNSYFTTNVPGEPSTLHGTIHGFGGFIFFTTMPVGIVLIARKFGTKQLLITVIGLLIGGVLLVAPIGTAGLAERVILFVIFSTVIFRSVMMLRRRTAQSSQSMTDSAQT